MPALLLAAGVLIGAAGCSGGGADQSSGSSGGAGAVAGSGAVRADAQDAASGADTGADTGSGTAAGSGTDGVETGRAVVSTATLAVRVRDLPAAVLDVRSRAQGAGGLVTSSTTGGGAGDETAHLTLRVPAPAFEDVLDAVAGLGQQTSRTTASNDVSAEVADVDSRVASAQAVLETFRARLPRATTVPDILAIEGEIARRQADLEALQARQRVLADQVALSTIDVDLVRGAPLAAVRAEAQPGFRGGLEAGWHALGEVGRVLSVVVGAVLPFALPLALVGVPLRVLVRRRRRRPGGGVDTDPAAGGAASAG
ncbi:DUF4349 domain-containing protein [Kineococcus rhizosphaerae]|uniref:DUF4349 domain-containing protein n=1 Tax=Kineococcus rhizosphaerae TaxID=559628 RepID=UPI0011B24A7D|nr:DUF4349 domain-containing protein [Kineococcus rhizosphaerae]